MISFFRKIRQKLLNANTVSRYLAYALGEILLVVIGILIALQVNNWNEDRKTKGAFTGDMALLKLVHLATWRIEKKWSSPLHNWALTVQQRANKFEGRLKLDINIDN